MIALDGLWSCLRSLRWSPISRLRCVEIGMEYHYAVTSLLRSDRDIANHQTQTKLGLKKHDA